MLELVLIFLVLGVFVPHAYGLYDYFKKIKKDVKQND